jgi:hypothetical protein
MTTFAQNIANVGFAWKILRTKDLMFNVWVVVFPALGVEPVVFWLTEMGVGLTGWLVLLVERLCIVPKWRIEISQ